MQSDTSSVDVVDDIDDDNNDNDDVGSSSEEKDSLGIMMMYSVRLLLVHYNGRLLVRSEDILFFVHTISM